MKPLLTIRQYQDQGYYTWALFRSDRSKPMVAGISREHAKHLKRICERMEDLPEDIKPIKDWMNYDVLVEVNEDGFGVDGISQTE